MKRLDGRIALVTGASRGIGRAAALALAKEGAHVIITGRTSGALEELDDEIQEAGGTATILQLDLKRLEKVDQLGPTLYQRWGKLDILVGNAGMLGNLTPLAHVTDDAWTSVMTVNLAANWRLIRTLDPLLQRSDAGRAIFVTSGAAQKATAAGHTHVADRLNARIARLRTALDRVTNRIAKAPARRSFAIHASPLEASIMGSSPTCLTLWVEGSTFTGPSSSPRYPRDSVAARRPRAASRRRRSAETGVLPVPPSVRLPTQMTGRPASCGIARCSRLLPASE